jgi:general stress protein 26
MPDTHSDPTAARAGLFDRLAALRAGMLGVAGRDARMRPMTHFADAEKARLHFLTSRGSALATEVGQGSLAHYCLVDEGEGYYAWMSGTLSPSGDASTVDELWSPMAAAWFTGRDDPDILLLTMPLREAEIWTSTDSTLHFGFEIARANLDPGHEPDVGSHEVIRF